MTVRIAPRPTTIPQAQPATGGAPAAQLGQIAPADRFEGNVAARTVATPAAQTVSGRFTLGNVYVPNGFQVHTSGQFPPAATGSFWTKLKQAALTAENSLKAEQSIQSGGTSPSDADVRGQLSGLHTLNMDPSGKTTHADYTSTILACDPATVYQQFVKNPGAVFGAGGLTVRPGVSELKDGQRLMLQAGGTPPLWMPIQVHLDPANNAIHITTLDGHPFRGVNDFQFVSDGKGGTVIDQKSAFQGSSDLIKTAGSGQLDQQHQTWEGVHDFLYTQCAGSGDTTGSTAVHVDGTPNVSIPAWDSTSDQLYVKSTDTLHSVRLNLDVAGVDAKHLKAYLTNDSGQIVRLGNFQPNGQGGVTGSFDVGDTLKGQSAKGYWTLYVGGGGVSAGVLKSWSLDINADPATAAA